MISLACELAGVQLSNPILMASGTFGFGKPYAALYPLDKLGGIVTKGLTLQARPGNTGTRVFETDSGLINSIGLENPGIPTFLEREWEEMMQYGTAIIVNLGGGSIREYAEGAMLITEASRESKKNGRRAVDMIELNISCPNVKEGGLQYGVDTDRAREVVRAVRMATDLPLLVKLSPSARDLTEMARMCEAEGADGLSLINTIQAMAIDIRKKRSVFDGLYAGLSGPAIKPIALRMVHQVSHAVDIPVIGIGGIASAEDILEFIMAGAAAVQIGTYNFMRLRAGAALEDELRELMAQEGIRSLDEIRGII
ncbi:Dihydroorotate dehydrogenase B (NAD(+)), catalytic subunit [Paenibacillus plantiphilus]|uniref:Dihydroorotate dehydrogenase n=1 Tax=Paenibacillus plantiphilus TaxID=2905650 RepID=A0ABN8GXZ3_9BACL|nr:dihydroorotate dehydrogenase [Paenibacillus plantiphilus]CAH1221787.1 Dihydroorotate dehydrogenase B (NAD(+)), catalytic subunit [Paenibacillus plantiphilus]